MQEPYFARFDFEEEGEDVDAFYVGIHTVTDPETGKILIYDWRARVGTLRVILS